MPAAGTLATINEEHDAGYSTRHVTVCESHRRGADYWFIQGGYNDLEVTIEFDRVAFDYRDDREDVIRTITFFRTDPRRPPIKTAEVEGGREQWGDDVIDALRQINEEQEGNR